MARTVGWEGWRAREKWVGAVRSQSNLSLPADPSPAFPAPQGTKFFGGWLEGGGHHLRQWPVPQRAEGVTSGLP